MTAEPLSKHLDSPGAERLLDEFEAAWRGGSPPKIADFLCQADAYSFDHAARRALLVELILIDLWHRWRRASSQGPGAGPSAEAERGHDQGAAANSLPGQPLLEDYARSYSELGRLDELPAFLVGEEYRIRRRWGDRPDHAGYFARFPSLAEQLAAVLREIDQRVAADTVGGGESVTREVPHKTTPAEPAPPPPLVPEMPEMIGKYHLVSVLDAGGQAEVYRALHPTLAKELVIKLGRGPSPLDRAETDRLAAEARLLAELDHPNLGRVYDLDVYQGRPYVVMEYIRGLTLQQYVEQHPLSARDTARLLAKIARAVAVAHAKGVVHQDIKPKNIMIDESGQPRIIDFGLARLRHAWSETFVEPGSVSGTIQFMAPEQARGETDQVNHRADIFALGAVLYWLLIGKSPFGGGSVHEALDRACRCAFDAARLQGPKVPRRLREICLRAMSAAPAARYASADDMASELERFAAGAGRRKWLIAAAVGAAGLVLAAVGLWKPSARVEPAPREPWGRRDFAITFAPVGGPAETPARLVFTEGQRVAFQFQADRDCYVGLWHVDKDGQIVQLFPNEFDRDHFVEAGKPRTIPGDLNYAVVAEVSQGPEFLHVVATTAPWKAEAGQQRGPYVIFATPEERKQWEEQVRALRIKKDDSPAIAELKLPLEVRPRKDGNSR